MKHSEDSIVVHGFAALAEGLDFPRPELVALTAENPLLQRIAPVDKLDAHWQMLTDWMQSIPDPLERLDMLQTGYYEMFLRPGTDLFLSLHHWYQNESPATFLADLDNLLAEMELSQSPDWSNGSDHLAIVFELLAHMAATQDPRFSIFVLRYVRPWFPIFVRRMHERAANDFYRVMSIIASEVDRAMEDLI